MSPHSAHVLIGNEYSWGYNHRIWRDGTDILVKLIISEWSFSVKQRSCCTMWRSSNPAAPVSSFSLRELMCFHEMLRIPSLQSLEVLLVEYSTFGHTVFRMQCMKCCSNVKCCQNNTTRVKITEHLKSCRGVSLFVTENREKKWGRKKRKEAASHSEVPRPTSKSCEEV